jgi:hypothetical protein
VDVVQTVRDLVGNARQFDFQQISDRLPLVDLPDLKPFLEVALTLNSRKMQEGDDGIGFLTPEPWMSDPAVRREYRNLSFDRTLRTRDAAVRVVGVGHKALDKALEQAASRSASVASISEADLSRAISVFRIRDRITGQSTGVRAVIVGVEHGEDGTLTLTRDWELLIRLNRLPARRVAMAKPSTPISDRPATSGAINSAERFVREHLQTIEHPFQRPDLELLAALLPA